MPRAWFIVFSVLLALWFGARIFVPPSWLVQRLDSPNGIYAARLFRDQYLKQAFRVQVKKGRLWQTVYYSPPITNDFSVDLEEHLLWSPDSIHVALEVQRRIKWVYSLDEKKRIPVEQWTEYTNAPGD